MNFYTISNSLYSKYRRFYSIIFDLFPFSPISPSNELIDIVIPIIPKDLKILPLCLEGVKACVLNKIKDIYIVSPASKDIQKYCSDNNLIFVDEVSVLGISPQDLNLIVNNNGKVYNRSGWLFQQLIKLSGKVGQCEDYLCIDSDHILIRPHVFKDNKGRTVFYQSNEQHIAYYENIERILPGLKTDILSYVDHKMLFNKVLLENLKIKLENISGKDWITTIIDSYDRNQLSGFSEFELYGNFVNKKVKRPWLQKTLYYESIADYKILVETYGNDYMSVTFPAYLNK